MDIKVDKTYITKAHMFTIIITVSGLKNGAVKEIRYNLDEEYLDLYYIIKFILELNNYDMAKASSSAIYNVIKRIEEFNEGV